MRIEFETQLLFYLGLYEIELWPHFRRLCSPGAVSWDVGASIGYDSLLLARLTGGTVWAFDCDDSVTSTFDENVTANPKWALLIHFYRGRVGAVNAPDGAVSIDGLVRELPDTPDILKIDVEGGELDVLEGGRGVIEEHRPSVIVEVHSLALENDCLSFLRDHGYQPVIVNQRRFLKDHRPIPHNRWLVASGLRPAREV